MGKVGGPSSLARIGAPMRVKINQSIERVNMLLSPRSGYSASGSGCCGLRLAFGVPAVARNFYPSGRIVAIVAAVFLAFFHLAVAGGMGAFLLFLLSHGSCLLRVHGLFVGHR